MADTYPIESQLVINTNGQLIPNGKVYVYDSDDTGNTTLLPLTDPNGLPITNPLTASAISTTPEIRTPVMLVKMVGENGAELTVLSAKGVVEQVKEAMAAAAEAASNAAASAALVDAPAGDAITAALDGNADVASALGRRLDTQVPPLVADAMASDSTIAAAGATAAQGAVNDALNTSTRIPKIIDATKVEAKWRSRIGRRLLARILDNGVFQSSGVQMIGDGGVTRAFTRTDYLRGTRIRVAGRAHPVLAQDALQADGRVPQRTLDEWSSRMSAPRSPKGRGIICRGDSLTAGAFGDGVSYPQYLSVLAPGVPIAKRGNPGERSKEISMRQGSTALTVTPDLAIPATGATAAFAMNTTLIFTNPNGTNGTPDGLAMVGTLNGIRGTLTATGGMFTFTRASSGDAATVPAGTPWIDEYESVRRDWNQVLWVGRNNVTATPNDVAVYVAKMVAYQTSGDYLVLGVTNSTAEPSGSANYTTILGINAALASAYPNNYLDIRGWLIANGLAAVSLTPTADDTTATSEDRIPPSLLAADGLHLNANGYKAVAVAVKNWITTKGWI
ncbi:hypothetical protein [Sinomonas soli]